MGTRNFYTENANYTYSLLPDTSKENIEQYRDNIIEVNELEGEDFKITEEDIIERIYEDFSEYEIEDTQKNIYSDIKAELEKINVDIDKMDEYDDDRNFCGRYFAEISFRDMRSEQAFWIKLVCRNGYYEGVNFDYEFYFTDGSDYEIFRGGEVKKSIEKKFEKTLDIIEKFYKMYTQVYTCLGTMSNGEAIYKAVN